jgi:hypothetical protein
MITKRLGSSKISAAVSKSTPCFATLLSALAPSHSNSTLYPYIRRSRRKDRGPLAPILLTGDRGPIAIPYRNYEPYRSDDETTALSKNALIGRGTAYYFTKRAAFGGSFSCLGPYQLLKDSARSWSRSDDWKMVRHMTIDELRGTDLGDFLKRL